MMSAPLKYPSLDVAELVQYYEDVKQAIKEYEPEHPESKSYYRHHPARGLVDLRKMLWMRGDPEILIYNEQKQIINMSEDLIHRLMKHPLFFKSARKMIEELMSSEQSQRRDRSGRSHQNRNIANLVKYYEETKQAIKEHKDIPHDPQVKRLPRHAPSLELLKIREALLRMGDPSILVYNEQKQLVDIYEDLFYHLQEHSLLEEAQLAIRIFNRKFPEYAVQSAVGGWSCSRCTFLNPESTGTCTMCQTPRAPDPEPVAFSVVKTEEGDKKKEEPLYEVAGVYDYADLPVVDDRLYIIEWECFQCTTWNPESAKVCTFCLTPDVLVSEPSSDPKPPPLPARSQMRPYKEPVGEVDEVYGYDDWPDMTGANYM